MMRILRQWRMRSGLARPRAGRIPTALRDGPSTRAASRGHRCTGAAGGALPKRRGARRKLRPPRPPRPPRRSSRAAMARGDGARPCSAGTRDAPSGRLGRGRQASAAPVCNSRARSSSICPPRPATRRGSPRPIAARGDLLAVSRVCFTARRSTATCRGCSRPRPIAARGGLSRLRAWFTSTPEHEQRHRPPELRRRATRRPFRSAREWFARGDGRAAAAARVADRKLSSPRRARLRPRRENKAPMRASRLVPRSRASPDAPRCSGRHHRGARAGPQSAFAPVDHARYSARRRRIVQSGPAPGKG